ncbi:MAG: Bax inhibitor-1/YccA family protein [Chloroflexota bacterium]
MFPQSPSLGALDLAEGLRLAMRRVYLWMAIGLFVTAGVALAVVSSEPLLRLILLNRAVFFGLLIGEFVVVLTLSALVNRMSPAMAALVFFFYAALNGATMSVIFLVYTSSSIAFSFFAAGAMFAAMSIVGYTTQTDLSKFGSLLFMGLIGLIVASVINLFLASSLLYWIISYVGIALFVGLTAYDTQWIKNATARALTAGDTQLEGRVGVMGALRLYLDFINLFLMILRVAGGRRR